MDYKVKLTKSTKSKEDFRTGTGYLLVTPRYIVLKTKKEDVDFFDNDDGKEEEEEELFSFDSITEDVRFEDDCMIFSTDDDDTFCIEVKTYFINGGFGKIAKVIKAIQEVYTTQKLQKEISDFQILHIDIVDRVLAQIRTKQFKLEINKEDSTDKS